MEEPKVLKDETENNESTEPVETEATEVDTCEEEGGSLAAGLALIGTAIAGVTALAIAVYRKFKPEKADKPKVKKRLRFVEVDPQSVVEVEDDDTDEENVEETECK